MGDKVTIADFALAVVFLNIIYNDLNPIKEEIQAAVKESAVLNTYVGSIHEELKDYLETRPKRAG